MRSTYLREPNQRDRWMVSYVDVLTILLIFFLVAAAKSLELPPAPPVVVPVPPPPVAVIAPPTPVAVIAPPTPVAVIAPVAEQPRTNLIRAQESLRDRGLESKIEARGLVISLPQAILFSSGVDTVSPNALPTLAQIGEVIRDIPNNVRLIGYADMAPIHTRRFGSNWELSMARSHKILELLSTRCGVPESRLSITSYGPYHPVASNDTEDGRALNRRVEILILDDAGLEKPQAQ
jgi:chemotaxis protein MotB